MTSETIAVVAPMGTLEHQPGILNAIACFCAAEYSVDVFALRNTYYKPLDLDSKRVNIRYLPISFRSRRESRSWITILFALWLPFILNSKYSYVYAGGVRALLAAWFASWFRRIRIINHNLELNIGARIRGVPFARVFKWIERRAIGNCVFCIEHDEIRARLLCKDAGIPRDQVEIVPNAPRGEGQIQRSRFLSERFGIGANIHLLVSAGTISPTFLTEETVHAAQSLPLEWMCVIHSAQPRSETDREIECLLAANQNKKVIFSLEPVAYADVGKIISSADIGLALYGSVGGPAVTEVGLASGKLCHFLQYGVPVIVSDFPMLREFVTKHQVGVPISDMADLGQAIETIMADYEGFCRRAAGAFTRELAFQIHFQRVLDRIAATEFIE